MTATEQAACAASVVGENAAVRPSPLQRRTASGGTAHRDLVASDEGGRAVPVLARSRRASLRLADRDVLPVTSISALSRATGASQRALRFYEAVGLLQPVRTSKLKRLYSPAQCALAQEIVLLRSLDIPLDHVRLLIDRERPAAEREDQLKQTLELIAARLETRARAARDALTRLATSSGQGFGASGR